jgi:hypothetical protein
VAATDTSLIVEACLAQARQWLRALRQANHGRRGRRHAVSPRALAAIGGAVAGTLGAGAAHAVSLPQDHAEAMFHLYDGGGTRASGPAVLVRKSVSDDLSLSASTYVDMVSNASIDVVTTASPYKETRTAVDLGADYVYRDAQITLGLSDSKEPDYTARGFSVDVAQEVFGGMTTVSLGFTRGADDVRKHNSPEFKDEAHHWQYRLGATQILTPKWLASANLEVVADDGFLGSPYRDAIVFGAAVPERNPRTRTSRAVEFRTIGSVGAASSVRASYRYFWDNWAIRAHTLEFGARHYFGDKWLGDAFLRYYTQRHALFYSDNATTETIYISRNRQLSTFHSPSMGAKATYTWAKVPGKYEVHLNAEVERKRFNYSDFTDIRTGQLYSSDATVMQLYLSANF